MPYVPKFAHLLKILLRRRDTQAAEGLFLEGSIEYESGDLESARLMFYYGTRLDPNLAGNFYNLAVVVERQQGASPAAIRAWEEYLAAAERDPRQGEETRRNVREHLAQLKSGSEPRT